MRIFPISDLHLERNERPTINADFDVMAFAGDGWEGEPTRTVEAIAQLAGGKPCVVIPGNHDYYSHPSEGRDIEAIIKAMREAADHINSRLRDDIVHVLAEGEWCRIAGAHFVGATLWSDWSIAGRWGRMGADYTPASASAAARFQVGQDFRRAPREYTGAIRIGNRSWRPDDVVGAHAIDRARILDGLLSAEDLPTIVVTHAPPLAEVVDAYDGSGPWWTPGFYASDFLREMPAELQPDLWICGHIHRACDLRYGRTRVVSNPVEGPDYRPDYAIEIDVPEPLLPPPTMWPSQREGAKKPSQVDDWFHDLPPLDDEPDEPSSTPRI